MPAYPYRPELKKPGHISNIDFSNPALAPMIRMVAKDLRQAARSYTPPEGLRVRTVLMRSWDKMPVECFIVEPETDAPLPGMLYCHGGGFFLPLQVSSLQIAAFYAIRSHIRVFLPEYRILPENFYPCPLRDCWAVWSEITRQRRGYHLAGRFLLYGESAGGTLAASLTQMLRDRGEQPPAGQLLIYPALDDRSERYPSMERYSGAAWTKQSNDHMWRSYLKHGYDKQDPYSVPLRNMSFEYLPPAYIEPQGIDILRDEGIIYAEKLRQADIPVELNVIDGSYHGFDSDIENPFVQQILTQRVHAMAGMLADKKNKENSP